MVKVQQYLNSWEVYQQMSYGQIIYDVFYGVNSLGKARMRAMQLNNG
jgi:hypothetical protein